MDLKMIIRSIIFVLVITFFAPYSFADRSSTNAAINDSDQSIVKQDEEPDIQWFKEELKIDPKYTETREGILGMSWAHFLTMAFLVIFFFGALIAYHRRTTRTARILEQLLREDQK
jgi:hypothetical protein